MAASLIHLKPPHNRRQAKSSSHEKELARIGTKDSVGKIRVDSHLSSDFKLNIAGDSRGQLTRLLCKAISKANALLKSSLKELSVILISDGEMALLHGQFMGDPATTDVMTFPLDLDANGQATTAEIYICLPEARRQAKARGILPSYEVLLYALHGLLHLNGFDDRTEQDYRRMHRREDRILIELGIGPVFAKPARKMPRSKRLA